MKRSRIIYIFILWLLFGISSTFLWWILFINYFYWPNVTVSLNGDDILKRIQSSLKTASWQTSWKYSTMDELRDILSLHYYDKDKLNFDKSLETAKKWFIEALWDPYTFYFNQKENESFHDDLKWSEEFEWIGAVVTKKTDWVQLVEIIKWSPAFKAWLKLMDIIIEVDGEKVSNMALNDIVEKKLRGVKWTEVELSIYRPSENKVLKVKLTRDVISVPSVSGKILSESDKKIWYIEISKFGEDTEVALEAVIKDFEDQKLDGMILDLRWNWWWIVPISVEVASHFIPSGGLVVKTKYKNYPDEDLLSKWYAEYEKIPMVILVDGMTASASEIIALALKQDIWAKILWTKSYGKWSIQTIYDFQDWSALKYTVWKRFAPNGETIDGKWIEPDIKVEFDTQAYKDKEVDNQLDKAKEEVLEMIKK